MTRVDFAFGATDRLRKACEVVRKHYEAGRQLQIYLSDTRQLHRFDRLLWGFEPQAFVPHLLADDPLAAQTPVLLTHQAPVPHTPEVWLLNLDEHCPPGFEQFSRILELVSERESDKRAARERWRIYQNAQCELHSHDLREH